MRQARCFILISSLLCRQQARTHLLVDGVIPRQCFSQTDRLELLDATLQESSSIVDRLLGQLLCVVSFPVPTCDNTLSHSFSGTNL